LLGYFRGYRGIGQWVEWAGPPNDPISFLLPEQKLETSFSYRWMVRLLDVRAALEARGYPQVDAEALFAVEDPMFPENAGPWSLRVAGGKASVERVETAAPRPIPIGVLSSMFTGHLRAPDAVRLGFLDADDPAVPAFSRSFDGPDPWCPFFF
jgi:predicted acetyltransferase